MFVRRSQWERLVKRVDTHTERFKEFDRNGIATAIKKLNKEVFKELREEVDYRGINHIFGSPFDVIEPTLNGKINAIIKHLGLTLSVTKSSEKIKVTKGKK